MKRKARETFAITLISKGVLKYEELISKGVLKYVYEVPEPGHVFIKIDEHIVYDVNDNVYYMLGTESADQLVHGYMMDVGYLAMLRKNGIIGNLV